MFVQSFMFFFFYLKVMNLITDIWFLKFVEITVTTVDSATKALKFLGLVEDEFRTFEPSIASEIHQVQFSNKFYILYIYIYIYIMWVSLNWWLIQLLMQDVDVNLIITDYCMPGMTGYDLLRKIKVRLLGYFSKNFLRSLCHFFFLIWLQFHWVLPQFSAHLQNMNASMKLVKLCTIRIWFWFFLLGSYLKL